MCILCIYYIYIYLCILYIYMDIYILYIYGYMEDHVEKMETTSWNILVDGFAVQHVLNVSACHLMIIHPS